MREAGRISAYALRVVGEAIQPGVTTEYLDQIAESAIRSQGATPAFLGYHGFPKTLCTSLNNEIVHGIPSTRVKLAEGDLVTVDVGAVFDGYYGDNAATFPVGQVSDQAARLVATTKRALDAGIEACRAGNRLYDIGAAIQTIAEGAGFSVVREYVGHGIGRQMHEDPNVPNYGRPGTGPKLEVGMVFAIEPMVNAGGSETAQLADGWTVVTLDGSLSAQFEHTVAITPQGPQVLTCE